MALLKNYYQRKFSGGLKCNGEVNKTAILILSHNFTA